MERNQQQRKIEGFGETFEELVLNLSISAAAMLADYRKLYVLLQRGDVPYNLAILETVGRYVYALSETANLITSMSGQRRISTSISEE